MRKKPENGIYLYEIMKTYDLSRGVAYKRFKDCKMKLNFNCREWHVYDIVKVEEEQKKHIK